MRILSTYPPNSEQSHHTKIKTICPHPILPWVICVERVVIGRILQEQINVFDYQKNVSIFSISANEITRRCSASLTNRRKSVGLAGDSVGGGVGSFPRTPPRNNSLMAQQQQIYSIPSTSSTISTSANSAAGDITKSPSGYEQQQGSTSSSSRVSLNLGSVSEVCFYDKHTLYWDMGIDLSSKKADIESSDDEYFTMISENSLWVVVLFTSNVVLINIVSGVCRLLDANVGTNISVTSVVPLNECLLSLGLNDGTLQFFEWQKGEKVGSERAHYRDVVQLIPASIDQYLGEAQRLRSSIDDSRFISIGAESNAILWKIFIVKNEEGQIVQVQSSRIAKMEHVYTKDNSASFDAQRGFFMSIHSGLNHFVVFDIQSLPAPSKGRTKILKPFLKLQVPGIGIGSVNLPTVHPSYSDTVITFWSLNKSSPEISLLASPISSREDQVIPEEHSKHNLSDLLVSIVK